MSDREWIVTFVNKHGVNFEVWPPFGRLDLAMHSIDKHVSDHGNATLHTFHNRECVAVQDYPVANGDKGE